MLLAAEVAVPAQTTPPAEPTAEALHAVSAFVVDRFDADDLPKLARYLELAAEIDLAGAASVVADRVVQAVARHGKRAALFEQLRVERPHFLQHIEGLENQWRGLDAGDWSGVRRDRLRLLLSDRSRRMSEAQSAADTQEIDAQIRQIRDELMIGRPPRVKGLTLDPTPIVTDTSYIWRAWESLGSGGRWVALKSLRPHLARDPRRRERFLRGADAMATLANPHIATIYVPELGDDPEECMYSMKWYSGGNLEKALDRWSTTEALRAVLGIGEALRDAHDWGIVHREVRPESMLTEGTHAVLADFGGCRMAFDASSTLSTFAGIYAAPEQLRRKAGPAVDVYGLGMTLLRVVVGAPLPTHLLYERSRTWASLELDTAVDTVLSKACAIDPADRYPSVAELLAAFRAVS
ncbi:MAG: serine/threonine protein kinase [Myxococcota bacterium]|jgi:serine/threonine protein kinase